MSRDHLKDDVSVHQNGGYVEVAVQIPLRRTFVYRVPLELSGKVSLGSRVAVPFGRRKLAAFIIGTPNEIPTNIQVKDVAGVLDSEPIFNQELLSFLLQSAEYYHYPVGEVLRAAAPALSSEAVRLLREAGFLHKGEKIPGTLVAKRQTLYIRLTPGQEASYRFGRNQQKVIDLLQKYSEVTLSDLRSHVKHPMPVVRSLQTKGILSIRRKEVAADPFFSVQIAPDKTVKLNKAQQEAVCAITRQRNGSTAAFLLYGVTGSGKTEVYLRAIAEFRSRGLGTLVLVPEIALTPQLVARFRSRFGNALAVLHSSLSNRERDQAWRNLRDGRVNIAVGARSALFAPVQNLGIIIVDEEHDASFKQEEGFRYHARDMALLRAYRASAVCVLGSATPSLESFYRAEQGKLQLLHLPERATRQHLPQVEIIDLNRVGCGPSQHRFLTAPLHSALDRCLQSGGQAILFLNRRGFSPSVRCSSCGELIQCPACNVSLTEHRRARILRCHYCNFNTPLNGVCPYCGVESLDYLGMGTEHLEEALTREFPQARVARLDRDTASGEGVDRVLERLRNRDIDILVGTQMVTKGHDIPGVVLVGVILADQSLAFPDFRASERTFQLLSQVAGRAGRGEDSGHVLIQSYQPGHSAVRTAQTHDYLGFYRAELLTRQELGYPPFSWIVMIRIDSGGEQQGRRVSVDLARVANRHPLVCQGRVKVLGPAPSPISRLRGRYRFQIMLRASERNALRSVINTICTRIDQGVSPARVTLDVDPVSML